MTGMTTRRWTDAGPTWFALSGVGPELAAPAEHVLMDYSGTATNGGEGWQLRVPPLDLQRAVSQRRGLTARVALIDALLS